MIMHVSSSRPCAVPLLPSGCPKSWRPAASPAGRLLKYRAAQSRAVCTKAGSSSGTGAGQLQPTFSPPGYLTDLLPENLQGYSDTISGYFDKSVAGNTKDVLNDAPRNQFFNPTKRSVNSTGTAVISWDAFPKKLSKKFANEASPVWRWKEADADRRVQDEYCEWSVERNGEGRITRVTITCEGPEFWKYLASVQPDTLLELYQRHISPDVQMGDLFNASGEYEYARWVNGPDGSRRVEYPIKWNCDTSNGAMHLIQPANTLSAEIELAAGASIVRTRADGTTLTDDQELIRCGRYGDPGRSSDPFIGAEVNQLARQGALIAVADPVAIYFGDFTPGTYFTTPDGTDVAQFMSFTRGSKGRYVRAVFEVPAGRGYIVGDIKHKTRNYSGRIEYGAQLVDYLKMKLVGLAADVDPANVVKVNGCVAPKVETRSRSLLSVIPTPSSNGMQAAGRRVM